MPTTPKSGFRPDIEGLRAVAVVAVLLYHAGLTWLPGGFVGVDVFFVISGFLITSLMMREIERDGRLRLASFWARRARRLLPASTLVLLFSAVVTLLWLPVTTRKAFGGDIIAAAWYVVNWRLGLREVDYLAENVGASPVQHYWSLAVEEQFYLVWPLLITVLVATFPKRRRLALLLGIAAVSIVSFVYALDFSVARPGLAFFFSTTRVWELGVGALLAIAYPVLRRLPRLVRLSLGWVGLALIAVGILTLDGSTTWPGTATLLPVLGTAAAILGGAGGLARRGVGRVLSLGPAVWIGGISYSLYLWHWPLLVAAEGVWGDLSVPAGLLVVLASVVPAWLSFRYVEDPMRRAPRLALSRPALLAGAFSMVVATVAGAAVVASFGLVKTVDVASAGDARGAQVIEGAGVDWTTVDEVTELRPSPLSFAVDIPAIYDTDCVVPEDSDRFEACEFGDVDGDRTVALVGDSKAVQWFTPVEEIARREGWRLVVIGKNTCAFADAPRLLGSRPNATCKAWAAKALAKLKEIKADVVLTVSHYGTALPPGSTSAGDYAQAPMVDGLTRYWQEIVDTGAKLVPILDTPGPRVAVPECVQDNLKRLTRCAYAKADGVQRSGAAAQEEAAAKVPEARVVDMSSEVCPDGKTCPAVIGNVLVYRSGTHLGDTYAETTRPALAESLAKATDGLFGAS